MLLLLRIFVFSGWILSHTFSILFLNSYNIFRSCSLGEASNSTSSANLKLVRQSWSWSLKYIPISFSCAIVEFRPSESIEGPCWTASWTADHLAPFLSGCRKCCSLRLSVQMPFGLCISSSGGWCNRVRCCNSWGRPKLICGWWNRTPSWSRLSLSTFWFSTRDISAQSSCTLQSGLFSGEIFWSQPDLPLVSGRALGIIFRTEPSRTVCTTKAMSKSGGSHWRSPRIPFLCITFIFTLFHSSSVKLFLFMISLKICLTISLVSSSHALMSTARTPLLSGDLPFLSLLIADCNSSVVISEILVVSSVMLWCTSMLLLFSSSPNSCSDSSWSLYS